MASESIPGIQSPKSPAAAPMVAQVKLPTPSLPGAPSISNPMGLLGRLLQAYHDHMNEENAHNQGAFNAAVLGGSNSAKTAHSSKGEAR
jgi:hypothetical protein